MQPEKFLFIDRDGTLIHEPEDQQIDSLAKLSLLPGVVPALLALRVAGFRLVMVSNQDGLGTQSFPTPDFETPQTFLLTLLRSQGIEFDAVFVCPHLPADDCVCRKPRTGLLTAFLADTPIDTQRSAVIGDRDTDLELAAALNLQGFKLGPELDWEGLSEQLLAQRSATVARKTKETDIHVTVRLGVEGEVEIDTGIGFFDHMLEQLAFHGGFSLTLRCNGDLHIDEHHTVEDTALTLGQALREAIGKPTGLSRYGFTLPMDESLAVVALDLSGRALFKFAGEFPRANVGQFPTEMVPHFFRSLADSLRATLHLSVQGENTHHMVEACFKATGRTLRQALRRDGAVLPSTKGML